MALSKRCESAGSEEPDKMVELWSSASNLLTSSDNGNRIVAESDGRRNTRISSSGMDEAFEGISDSSKIEYWWFQLESRVSY